MFSFIFFSLIKSDQSIESFDYQFWKRKEGKRKRNESKELGKILVYFDLISPLGVVEIVGIVREISLGGSPRRRN